MVRMISFLRTGNPRGLGAGGGENVVCSDRVDGIDSLLAEAVVVILSLVMF